jgi:hypothetical protein
MTSSYHIGTYPSIIEQIKTLIDIQFKDFNILRLKIKSAASNNGVPENYIDKLLFWDKKSNYFEFHYKILIKSTRELTRLKELCINQEIHLAHNALKKTAINEMYYIATMRLFYVGRRYAFIENKKVIQYLTENDFRPLKVQKQFVVYDSNIDLDNEYIHVTSNPSRTYSTVTTSNTRRRYRIGTKNRKTCIRSTI